MSELYAGIEAGGTKFVCAVGSHPDNLVAQTSFPTTTPELTLDKAVNFFRKQETKYGKINALGIASFGPVNPQPGSPTYGYITATPKPGWSNTDMVGYMKSALEMPVGFDTDVNGAAFGEWRWGAARGLESFIYLTIGTGIGGGGLVNGALMHGLIHPEMGHTRLPHDWLADPYPGGCPFHGDCFEGLANGPAIEERWGQRAETLPTDHPAWDLEALYIALGLMNYICTLSPERIILGGGVMEQSQLFPKVRVKVQDLLNGYVQHPHILSDINEYIVPPELGGMAGVLGAIALAIQANEQ